MKDDLMLIEKLIYKKESDLIKLFGKAKEPALFKDRKKIKYDKNGNWEFVFEKNLIREITLEKIFKTLILQKAYLKYLIKTLKQRNFFNVGIVNDGSTFFIKDELQLNVQLIPHKNIVKVLITAKLV